jgi:hypothetical protein
MSQRYVPYIENMDCIFQVEGVGVDKKKVEKLEDLVTLVESARGKNDANK